MKSLEDLRGTYNDIPGIHFEKRGDLCVMVVDSNLGYAEILMQGAQLIAYKQQGKDPVIWRSALTTYSKGAPIRGGIPIIGPWFGNMEDNPIKIQSEHDNAKDASAHGFLRNVQWDLKSVEQVSRKIMCTFTYSHDGLSHGWQAPFDAVLKFEIGSELRVNYEVQNTGEKELNMSAALHTYFAVRDIERVSIDGFDGVQYVDALDQRAQKVSEGEVKVDKEIDVVYLGVPTKQVIHDAAAQRDITLETHGSTSAILWNPWTEKAKSLSMFADDEYKEMVCLETARVCSDMMRIQPGRKEEFGVTISVG